MSALISIPFEIKGNYTIALDQRDYANDCGFVVMWSDMTNELLPKGVNLDNCSHAKVYLVMDEKTGETCFYFFSQLHARNNNLGKILYLN